MLRPILTTVLLFVLLFAVPSVKAQEVRDRFTRADGNTVGNGWSETETGAAGAAINGNELKLQETSNNTGRQFVSMTTPGTYVTTLNQNNCTMTWACNMRQTQANPTGFDSGDYGIAYVLAGSTTDFTAGSGYAIVIGESSGTDNVRLVRYNNGVDADGNLTDVIASTNDATNHYIDVRVTYVPSTNTWSLYYNDNGTTGWGDPLTASTLAGTAVNSTYTGTALPAIGCLWNHGGTNNQLARFDNIHIPGGRPTVPTMTPTSATICNGSGTSLSAASTSSTTARTTFNSTAGPSTVSASGVNNGSIYPWTATISGLPTSGVTVESVTLNGVTHTYPDDLDILLQSPTGTNVVLMSDIGGGDNISNNTYTIMDEAPSFNVGALNNSGMYAPTNEGSADDYPSPGPGNGFDQGSPTLGLFTGDFNGTWNLFMLDDANVDGGQIGSWSITFTYNSTVTYTWSPGTGLSATTGATVTASPTSNQTYTVTAAHSGNGCTRTNTVAITVVDPPTASNAGSTQTICAVTGIATMAANAAGIGTGAWSQVSGPVSATIVTASSPTTNITGMTTAGSYVFRWTISNNPCTASFSDVTIVSNGTPTAANAGSTQNICVAPGSTTMAANTPSVGTGAWSQVSGPVTATIVTPSSPTTSITGMTTVGSYVFRWTISNNPCTASQSNVTVNVGAQPTTAAAGSDQNVCTSVGTITMAANTPAVGTGLWSQVSGPSAASIVTASSPSTVVNGLTTVGTYVFRWTISNGSCPASISDMNAVVNGVPTTANAGSPQSICANPGTVTMAANTPSVGAGTWTQLSGPLSGTITTPASPTTTITGLTATGSYVFRWTISNSPCISSQNSVTITVGPEPSVADAGSDQDVCVSPGTATMAANTPGVGTGTWSQISGPVAVSIADSNDPVTGMSGFNTAGTYVFRWSITTTGCAASTDDVTVNVAGSPTTAAAGADQPVCSLIGTATMAANAPSVGVGAWTQIAGPVSATIANAASATTGISGMTTVGTYTFRWTITNSPCSPSTDDVDLVSGGCTYYSQASGDISDAIWDQVPAGAPGFATFLAGVNMVVQSGHTVTNSAVTAVGDVNVNSGGTLLLNDGSTFQVNGSNPVINGTLTANNNTIFELAGSAATTLTLGVTTSFFDLTVNTPSGTTLSGVAHIRGTLLLEDGAFAAGTNQLVLRSTQHYTGRLGPVAATASYGGNLKIERYIPAGATNWRLLGSPLANRKVVHWQDDFATAGYPGSQVPLFDDPVGSGILWPSIRWYDETNPGAGSEDGMTGVSNHLHPLAIGQGFAAWCGTGLTNTSSFVVDLENQVPIIASTPITLPMTYTNSGNPSVDGWNLVSNPVPSPIAFDLISRGADVADYVTFYDPSTGNMATWDISMGSGTNGGTNTIQSSQGFFLRATGADVTTTVSEDDKVPDTGGGFFGGTVTQPGMVRLKIFSAMNSFSDETMVVFTEGAPETNGDDVPKYIFAHPNAPQLASIGDDGQWLAINAYGPYSNAISIPLGVDVGVTGAYTVLVSGLAEQGLSCIRIEDLLTGAITPMTDSASYTFNVDAATDPTAPRLILHASAPIAVNLTDAACNGENSGSAELVLTEGSATVTLLNDMGNVLAVEPNASGIVSLGNLGVGDYQVSLDNLLGCMALNTEFHIGQPDALAISASTMDATCANSLDGQVLATVSGGTAPYSYLWNNGATEAQLNAIAGSYNVTVTDDHGCVLESGAYSIGADYEPIAMGEAVNPSVLMNVPVVFINNSTGGDSYTWDFGDGSTSQEVAPEHTYLVPGVYTVTLVAMIGDCSSSITIEITVEVNTGVTEVNDTRIAAWMNNDNLVVEHGFTDKYPLQLDVLNEAGQVFMQHRVAGPAGRLTLPAGELASGIWYIRVSNNEVRRTIPVVIAR